MSGKEEKKFTSKWTQPKAFIPTCDDDTSFKQSAKRMFNAIEEMKKREKEDYKKK